MYVCMYVYMHNACMHACISVCKQTNCTYMHAHTRARDFRRVLCS